MLVAVRPSCCLLLLALASLPVPAETVKLLSVRSEDPQLALSARRASGGEDVDSLGMHLDLGLGEVGKTRFALNAASQDSATPRLETIKVDHKLDLSNTLLMPLPGKLDLGLHLTRQMDKVSAKAWDMGVKPQLKTQFGPLAVKLGMSVERSADAGREIAVGYHWASSVDLTPRMSLDLTGKGLRKYDRGLVDAGSDTLSPKISGRYRFDRSLAFSYGLGAQVDLNSRETRPDLNLNVELKF
jgi:hypothetical protein